MCTTAIAHNQRARSFLNSVIWALFHNNLPPGIAGRFSTFQVTHE
ncbi:hypothetical protein GCK32_013469 [Trichostrongylus colubriformis]|uniref:Uncharacterized protein n=1 Tax=Trichostrongylus colubriformis TaxID=6319 RepID=A0AAN8F0J4_TRICO